MFLYKKGKFFRKYSLGLLLWSNKVLGRCWPSMYKIFFFGVCKNRVSYKVSLLQDVYIKPKPWLRFLHKVSAMDVLKNCFCILQRKERYLKQYMLRIFHFTFHLVKAVHVFPSLFETPAYVSFGGTWDFARTGERYSCFTTLGYFMNHQPK